MSAIAASLSWHSFLASRAFTGYFQSEEGQYGCINCDSLGDFYQEMQGQTSCQVCAAHTQRFIGVLSALNRSSCQCKEGATSVRPRYSMVAPTAAVRAGYYARNAQSGQVRSGFECACSCKLRLIGAIWLAGVREVYYPPLLTRIF